LNISYDPIRTSKIGLVIYENGLSSYILLQKGVKVDTLLYSGSFFNSEQVKKGDSILLKYMPLFSVVSNIENKPYKGGSLCRAAGVGSVLIGKKKGKGILKLNSGWQLEIPLTCIASLGVISNKWNNNIIGKAGKSRWLGFKPKVRGVAMNPCDHPHGGGNGKKVKTCSSI